MPKINLNSVLQAYSDFADRSIEKAPDAKTVSRIGISGKDGKPRVIASTTDSCGVLSRDNREQVMNNKSRYIFFMAVANQFGGVDRIPKKVRDALYMKDFGDVEFKAGEKLSQAKFMTGKPLQAYRIKKVIAAIESVTNADAKLLAENRIQGVLGILKSGQLDRGKLETALKSLIDSALPPKWRTSTHFDPVALMSAFGTRSIGELRNRILSVQYRNIIAAAMGDGEPAKAPDGAAAAGQIADLLADLEKVFRGSHKGKGTHVTEYRSRFDELNGNWEGRSVRYDSRIRGKCLTEQIESTSRHAFNPDSHYATASGSDSSKAFVEDLLHAMALAKEGNFGCQGDARASELNLLNWVKDKLCEAYVSSLPEDANKDELRSFFRKGIDSRHDVTKSVHFQIKQLVDGFVSMARMAEPRFGDDAKKARQAWFEGVQEKTDTFGTADFSLGKELLRRGVIRPFSDADRHLLHNIATVARVGHKFRKDREEAFPASPKGREGGAGYMGLLDGEPFKFLTKFLERAQIADTLTLKELAQVNVATKELRDQLNRFAEQTGDQAVISAVKKLLAPKVTEKNDLDLIARTNVAMALAYIEPYVIAENGNMGIFGASSWIDEDTGLKTMLRDIKADERTHIRSDADAVRYLNGESLESERREEAETGSEGRSKADHKGETDAHRKNNQPSGAADKVEEKKHFRPRPDTVNARIRQDQRLLGVFQAAGFGADVKFRHVESSASNFDCLFYSIKNALGADGQSIADVHRFRTAVDNEARRILGDFCRDHNLNYEECLRNPAEKLTDPEYPNVMFHYAEYLATLERNRDRAVFADSVLLNIVVGEIRRPVILVSEDLNAGGLVTYRFDNGLDEAEANLKPIVIYYNGSDHFDALLPEANVNGEVNDYHPIPPNDEEPEEEEILKHPRQQTVVRQMQAPKQEAKASESPDAKVAFADFLSVAKGKGDKRILLSEDPKSGEVRLSIRKSEATDYALNRRTMDCFRQALERKYGVFGKMAFESALADRYMAKQGLREKDVHDTVAMIDRVFKVAVNGEVMRQLATDPSYMNLGHRDQEKLRRTVLALIDKNNYANLTAIESMHVTADDFDMFAQTLLRMAMSGFKVDLDKIGRIQDDPSKAGWTASETPLKEGDPAGFALLFKNRKLVSNPVSYGSKQTSVEKHVKSGALVSGMRVNDGADSPVVLDGLKNKGVEPGFTFRSDWTRDDTVALMHKARPDEVSLAAFAEFLLKTYGADSETKIGAAVFAALGVKTLSQDELEAKLSDAVALEKIKRWAFVALRDEIVSPSPRTRALPEFTGRFGNVGSRFRTLNVMKLDYSEGDINFLGQLTLAKRVQNREDRKHLIKLLEDGGFSINSKFLQNIFRVKWPVEINADAVSEALANDLMRISGIPTQEMSLSVGQYSNFEPKLMLQAKFEPSYRDLDSANNGKTVLADGGYLARDITIDRFAEQKIFMMLLGDRDAIGSKGQNKGVRIGADGKMTFFAIDPGHSLEGNRLKVADDFSFSGKAASEFKNFTVFDDFLRSEKFVGVLNLTSGMREKYENLFKDYKRNVNALYREFESWIPKDMLTSIDKQRELLAAKNMILTRIDEMEKELLGQFDHIVNVFEDQIKLHREIVARFDVEKANKAIDAIELFEKITSPTSEFSSDKGKDKFRLRHLRIKKGGRLPWKAEQLQPTGDLEFRSVKGLSKDAKKDLERILPQAFGLGLEKFEIVHSKGETVVRIKSADVETFLSNGDEEVVRRIKHPDSQISGR